MFSANCGRAGCMTNPMSHYLPATVDLLPCSFTLNKLQGVKKLGMVH